MRYDLILQDIECFLQSGGLRYLVITQTFNDMEQYLGLEVSVLNVSRLRNIIRRRHGFPVGYQRVALDLDEGKERDFIVNIIREQSPETEIF